MRVINRLGMILSLCLLGFGFLAAAVALAGPTATAAPMITLEPFATGLTRPLGIAVTGAPGDERLFVVEQDGLVKIVQPDGSVESEPFLDVSDKIDTGGNEQGLLGLAFHPNFENNGYFYVNYVRDDGDDSGTTIVSRFELSTTHTADPNSELVLMEIDQPYENHNGGDLHFGPNDGYLYIGLGDGGSADDPDNNGQTTSTPLGALLRIDVDNPPNGNDKLAPDCGSNDANYSIPADNPLAGNPSDDCDEIWAYGLRNPWRFSFDRATGDLYIGDVGQGAREEIDFQPAGSPGGENYGWRCFEGEIPNPDGSIDCDPPDDVLPIFDYPHDSDTGGFSVTGGYVYRGSRYPFLAGYYFFGDYATRRMWSAKREDGVNWTIETLGQVPVDSITSFGEDAQGELYLVSRDGTIYHIQGPETATLEIHKTGPAIAYVGEEIAYTLTATNTSTVPAAGVTITDEVPANANFVSATAGGSLSGDTVTWMVGELGAGQAVTVHFTVTAAQTITNATYAATAEGDISAAGAAAVTTEVVAELLRLEIDKAGPATADWGAPITYTLDVTNTGNVMATGVTITDSVPLNAGFASATAGGTLAGGVVSWDVGTLAPNDTASVQFVVTATQSIVNEAYGVAADGGYQLSGDAAVQTLIAAERRYLPFVRTD